MRQRAVGEHHNQKQCDDYRSHPLSTSDATPCIESAKTKMSAEAALSSPKKAEVPVNVPFRTRMMDRQDMIAARQASSIPKKAAIADDFP
jgi:hypothetical protein